MSGFSSLKEVWDSVEETSVGGVGRSFFEVGRGVPDLPEMSSALIMPSGSNSEGSGPFGDGSSSFASDLATRLLGDLARTACLLAPELDLEGDCEVRWRACSSAIRESIAPFRRCAIVSVLFSLVDQRTPYLKHDELFLSY